MQLLDLYAGHPFRMGKGRNRRVGHPARYAGRRDHAAGRSPLPPGERP